MNGEAAGTPGEALARALDDVAPYLNSSMSIVRVTVTTEVYADVIDEPGIRRTRRVTWQYGEWGGSEVSEKFA